MLSAIAEGIFFVKSGALCYPRKRQSDLFDMMKTVQKRMHVRF